jgi:uracil-DNA glycosylase
MKQIDILQIEDSWYNLLKLYFESPVYTTLIENLKKEQLTHSIYPDTNNILKAYNTTLLDQVKIVILGQDPYHNKGEAHGLSFSVPESIKFPPSLKNIFQELDSDLATPIPESGDLTRWAEQGVLLLNSYLTVRDDEPLSHKEIGWRQLTDYTISQLSFNKEGIIFLLWGNHAKSKISLINTDKHHVLTAAHPSPFSAYNGFFGCKHFSKANELLIKQGKEPINW